MLHIHLHNTAAHIHVDTFILTIFHEILKNTFMASYFSEIYRACLLIDLSPSPFKKFLDKSPHACTCSSLSSKLHVCMHMYVQSIGSAQYPHCLLSCTKQMWNAQSSVVTPGYVNKCYLYSATKSATNIISKIRWLEL